MTYLVRTGGLYFGATSFLPYGAPKWRGNQLLLVRSDLSLLRAGPPERTLRYARSGHPFLSSRTLTQALRGRNESRRPTSSLSFYSFTPY